MSDNKEGDVIEPKTNDDDVTILNNTNKEDDTFDYKKGYDDLKIEMIKATKNIKTLQRDYIRMRKKEEKKVSVTSDMKGDDSVTDTLIKNNKLDEITKNITIISQKLQDIEKRQTELQFNTEIETKIKAQGIDIKHIGLIKKLAKVEKQEKGELFQTDEFLRSVAEEYPNLRHKIVTPPSIGSNITKKRIDYSKLSPSQRKEKLKEEIEKL